MSYTIKIKGLKELQRSFDKAPDQIQRTLQEALRLSGEEIKQKARENAGSPPTVYTGQLARSITNTVKGLTATIGPGGNAKRYAAVVEFGRKPGSMPPVDKIERWARTKIGKSGLGFVIAKKIKQKGTKAQPYMKPALDNSIKEVEKIFNKAIAFMLKKL